MSELLCTDDEVFANAMQCNALDDGSWDKRIEEAGCKKISVWEFSKVLNPLGVKVINEPSRIISEIMACRNDRQAA